LFYNKPLAFSYGVVDIQVREVAVVQQAFFKRERKEYFGALVKLRSYNFAVCKLYIMQTAPLQLHEAEVAADESAGGELRVSKDTF